MKSRFCSRARMSRRRTARPSTASTRSRATSQAAPRPPQIADAKRAADTAAAAFPAWSATGPNARRAILLKAADLLASKAPQFIELMAAETGATAGWAGFNVHLAAGMLREAAAMTTQISGEVIPSDKPGCIAMAIRQPAGVVLSMAPWNAPVILGVRAIAHAARLRQHRGAEGLRNLSGHPPADRRMPARRRPAAGRPQRHHQRAGRCAGPDRDADRRIPPCAGSISPARRGSAASSRRSRPNTSSRRCSNSAARRR